MKPTHLIEETKKYIQETMQNDSSHDWWHIQRVWQTAVALGQAEGDVDMTVIQLAALLHDIGDYKFHGGDDSVGPQLAREWLTQLSVDTPVIDHICDIIAHLSFKGANVPTPMATKEGMVVQDADRLDAIGAIGIGRTFAYGGHKGHPMHNPHLSPHQHTSFADYKSRQGTTINHFYEKLLLLKQRMNTPTAQRIAAQRHQFMETFLQQFLIEWDSQDIV